jgi:hypothetical protein
LVSPLRASQPYSLRSLPVIGKAGEEQAGMRATGISQTRHMYIKQACKPSDNAVKNQERQARPRMQPHWQCNAANTHSAVIHTYTGQGMGTSLQWRQCGLPRALRQPDALLDRGLFSTCVSALVSQHLWPACIIRFMRHHNLWCPPPSPLPNHSPCLRTACRSWAFLQLAGVKSFIM